MGYLPWWMVDLGEELLVMAVKVTNRDTSFERLRDFTIETGTVGSTNGTLVAPKLCYFAAGIQGRATTVRYQGVAPIMARFVKISLTASGYLQLCEVAVIGTETQKFYLLEQRKNKKSNGTVLFSGLLKSVATCVAQCSQTKSCTSINIKTIPPGTVLCELRTDSPSNVLDSLVDASGWVHYFP
ncbi:uncharacterized protein LOC135475716 [Liolophura sinensis]|uniref:uncharacterized protein LOC135475716 n=1 Tax=Liolophura sinensis TaxID=3198878 RepID=UPI0031593CDF